MACQTPANASPTCDGSGCGFACNLGFMQQGGACNDINECLTNNGGCSVNAGCTNTSGGRTCTCNSGFTGDGVICNDVNECSTNNGGCSANATCTNSIGGRTCACNSGYAGDGVTCNDVNECATNNGGCGTGTCTNTPGGRTCACATGYVDNGSGCVDVNECAVNHGGCDINASCTNTPGSRTCACSSGWSGDGLSCSDINECATSNGGCSVNATCTNTQGSRTCACNSGYAGDGFICSQSSQQLVVVRVGSGAGALSGVSTEVHLEVRDVATGAVLSDIAMPTAASGGNYPFTLSGTASAEGMLNLSMNNQYLVLAGYAATPGTAGISTAPGVTRVVGRVDLSGTVNTATTITDSYADAGFRSAASVDGTGYWVAGASAGVRYVVQGALGSSTAIYGAITNLRTTELFNGQLYVSTAVSPNPDGGTDLSRIFAVGSGLPTSATSTVTYLPGLIVNSPSSFAFADRSSIVSGVDTLYVAETNGSTAVRRFDFDGVQWSEGATFPMTGSTYFMTVIPDTNAVKIITTGSYGIATWVDTGGFGAQSLGTVLTAASPNTVLRGIVVMP